MPLKPFAFGEANRLLKARDYQVVFDDNKFQASHKNILILAKPNQLSQARLGIIVSKKNAKRAVDRNRLKRIIRERFRLKQTELAGVDMIVLARSGLAKLDNTTLASLLDTQLQNIQLQL